MEQVKWSDNRKTKEKSPEDIESQYWRDFIRGLGVEKYGKTRIIKKWIIEKVDAETCLYGYY